MLLWVWGATLAVEIFLLRRLWAQDGLPWFTIWMSVNWTTSIIEMAIRNHDWVYDPFWRCAETLLMVLLFPAVAECLRDVPAGAIRRAVITALVTAVTVHALLPFPLTWPGSYLDVVFGCIALTQLVLGLFLVQVCVYGSRNQRHAVIFSGYMLATSVCYYAASSFPTTIGTAEMGIECMAVLAWLT